MIQKGRSISESLTLRTMGGATTVHGCPVASFGYKSGSTDDGNVGGVWADWSWSANHFEVQNDALGFYPIFYRENRDGIAVSSRITDLVEPDGSTELDDAAVSVFLRLGFYVGDDTPFRGVRVLAPGSKLSYQGNRLRVDHLVDPPERKPTHVSRHAAINEYGLLFQSAVEKLADGDSEKTALLLSGGRDSRHILLALLKANRRPDCCITMKHIPPKSDEDAVIAAQVSSFDKLNHTVLARVTNLLEMELRKNLLTNFCADEHAWILPLREHLSTNRFTTVYDGIGGDVLSAGLFLTEERLRLYREGRLRQLAENMLGPEGYLPEMLRSDCYQLWSRERAIGRLISELEKYSDCPNPVGQFYFWNRTRREIATSCWGILNKGCHVLAPYLDSDVYAFLASLPASYFLDHTFHTETISRFYPEHAHLPYQVSGVASANMGWQSVANFAWDASKYCLLASDTNRYVNRSFFVPRVGRGLVDPRYGESLYGLFNRAIYLAQLEQTRRGGAMDRMNGI